MNPDNIISVNIPNIITIGLMFMGFVILFRAVMTLASRFSGGGGNDMAADDA